MKMMMVGMKVMIFFFTFEIYIDNLKFHKKLN